MIYVINQGGSQSYIMDSHYKDWNKSKEQIKSVANFNLKKRLEETQIDTLLIEGRTLGYFDTEFNLKSVLLTSEHLKQKLATRFGWPVYAVLPVKDFCYFFSEKDLEFFSNRLGTTVLEEYNQSPHPITRELVKISDEGIKAIGEYKD
jgi:hypothetical protein